MDMLQSFPKTVCLTITNNCNMRCKMCAQWSDEGYIKNGIHAVSYTGKMLSYERLLCVIDEVAENKALLIIRGGEPLLYPRIDEVVIYAKSKQVELSLETNGWLLDRHAEVLVKNKLDNLRLSLDGPEEIHDLVRGRKGAYARLKKGLEVLAGYEKKYGYEISKGIACTISGHNYASLAALPDAVRDIGLKEVCIVPYYYFPEQIGKAYEKIMQEEFSCKAYSWKGFHHENSGVDPEAFITVLHQYKKNVLGLIDVPYMELSDDEYRAWFSESTSTVCTENCANLNGLLDIQPDGSVNFCVDFPDYVIGNAEEHSLKDLWTSERARKFREYRSSKQLPICYRCANKFMGL